MCLPLAGSGCGASDTGCQQLSVCGDEGRSTQVDYSTHTHTYTHTHTHRCKYSHVSRELLCMLACLYACGTMHVCVCVCMCVRRPGRTDFAYWLKQQGPPRLPVEPETDTHASVGLNHRHSVDAHPHGLPRTGSALAGGRADEEGAVPRKKGQGIHWGGDAQTDSTPPGVSVYTHTHLVCHLFVSCMRFMLTVVALSARVCQSGSGLLRPKEEIFCAV